MAVIISSAILFTFSIRGPPAASTALEAFPTTNHLYGGHRHTSMCINSARNLSNIRFHIASPPPAPPPAAFHQHMTPHIMTPQHDTSVHDTSAHDTSVHDTSAQHHTSMMHASSSSSNYLTSCFLSSDGRRSQPRTHETQVNSPPPFLGELSDSDYL